MIVLCLVFLLGLAGCGNTSNTENTENTENTDGETIKYVDLEVIQEFADGEVLVDRNTGVLYLCYDERGTYGLVVIPLYNADGTLRNISDFE